MRIALRPLGTTFMLACSCALASLILPASGGAAATGHCGSFENQAAAQAYFEHHGGSPRHGIGGLDHDGDGVACEELDGPYVGFATVAYNRPRDFFYGSIAMPRTTDGEFACLSGNPHFVKGPRLVSLMKVEPGPDVQVFHKVRTQVRPQTGHLVWKIDITLRHPGRYYAEVAERVRLRPFGANQCPSFHTRAVALPQSALSG